MDKATFITQVQEEYSEHPEYERLINQVLNLDPDLWCNVERIDGSIGSQWVEIHERYGSPRVVVCDNLIC